MNDRSNSFLTLDALIICYNRQTEVDLAIESCNLDEIQTVYVLDNASDIPIAVKPEVSLIRSDKNLGPCNGRNALALKSSADLLLFLDDDAELSSKTDVSSLIKAFESDPNLAIMASLATRGDGQIARHEFPARKVNELDVPRDVGYFVGCGFIIRSSVLRNLKGFDGNFFYWHEETDMSLRVAAARGRIVYNPAFQVTHRPSVKGRDLTAKNYSRQMRNRKILAWRSLPRPVSYFHLTIWFVHYLMNSSPTLFFSLIKSALYPITKEEKTIGRLPLPYRRLNQLQRIGYRIYW